MHRRKTSVWSLAKEIKPFRLLVKHIHEDDLVLVERYYRKNWPPRTGVNHLRHDLATLINNWSGECDRARIWNEAHPIRQGPRKIIPLPMIESNDPVTACDPDERARFLAEYQARHGRPLRGYEQATGASK